MREKPNRSGSHASIEFKKQRRLNYLKRKSRKKYESNREGISYESGIALTLAPELLQKAIVTQQELKEFEKFVLTFSERPPKKYITCPVDGSSASVLGFVIFDTETSCAGKQAEEIHLAVETKEGPSFSRFTTPTKEIFPDASRLNKFKTIWVGGKKEAILCRQFLCVNVFDYLLISLRILSVPILVTKLYLLAISIPISC